MPLRTAFFLLLTTALSIACSYEVSVNKRVVYTPPPLFSNYNIADAQLKECVRASIEEVGAVSAKAVTSLLCPPGDIRSLEGIQVFTSLKKLGLADNLIEKVEPLLSLAQLTQLDASGNQIKEVSPLSELKSLDYLDVRRNPISDCEAFKLGITQHNLNALSDC